MRNLIVWLLFHLKDDHIYFVWFFDSMKNHQTYELICLLKRMRRFKLIVSKFFSRNNVTVVKKIEFDDSDIFFWIDIFSDFRFDNNIFYFYNLAVKVLRIQKNHDIFIIFHFDCAFYYLINAVQTFLKKIENNSKINNDLI